METEEDIKKIAMDILRSSQTLNTDKDFAASLLVGQVWSRYNFMNEVIQNKEKYKKHFNDTLNMDFDLILSMIKSHDILFQMFCIANSDIIISNLKGE